MTFHGLKYVGYVKFNQDSAFPVNNIEGLVDSDECDCKLMHYKKAAVRGKFRVTLAGFTGSRMGTVEWPAQTCDG